jgi:hypothetical protein
MLIGGRRYGGRTVNSTASRRLRARQYSFVQTNAGPQQSMKRRMMFAGVIGGLTLSPSLVSSAMRAINANAWRWAQLTVKR